MEKSKKLFLIKFSHTAIWCVFVAAILYVCYAGVSGRIGALVWWCAGLIFFEGVVLLVNRGECLFSPLARRYTDDHSAGFDIFVPAWLIKRNTAVFTTLFFLGFALVLLRVAGILT